MIAYVSGNLISKSTEAVVVDTGGVGYELLIPLTTFSRLPEENSPVSLIVHTHLKEDSITLYGFLTPEERSIFRLLIGVTGIGPRLARNILSGISPSDLVSSISREDSARLSSIPGIGAKSAERLILELRDKVKALGEVKAHKDIEPDADSSDVVSALDNLGYKNSDSRQAVKTARAHLRRGGNFEELLKESLKILSRK
jgi:Holliday junction DNA helicase RuvA